MLSDRERIVLRLIASGYTQGQIAYALRIHRRTVEEYCNRVFAKLGAVSSPHAVALGIKSKEISLDEIHDFPRVSVFSTTR
jgi:DNA-binding CsgD family transcriptional regulator